MQKKTNHAMGEENRMNHLHRRNIPLKYLVIDSSEETLTAICGRERLNVVNEENAKIGTLKVSVSVYEEGGKHQFVIHASSSVLESTSDTKCGMSLTSRVTPKYETLEEFRSQYSIVGGIKSEKIFHLIKLKDEYSLSISNKSSDYAAKNTFCIPPDKLKNYLSEGANFLLIKYFAQRRAIGRVKTQTILINGDICRSQLFVFQSGLQFQKVLTNTLTAVRTVKGPNGMVQKIYSWMNLKGQFMRQEWPNTGRSWRLEYDKDIQPGTLHTPLSKRWEDDVQMKSIFIDRVENLKTLYRSYILDYPELKRILTDFILQVTLDKPDNITEYAIEFFTSIGLSNG